MTKSNESSPPGEIHVHHLFGFALGMVAGANAARRAMTSEQTPAFEDLPQGYAFGGTKLDTLAGDALLESNSQWYLLELKRSFSSLPDELTKARVLNIRKNGPSWIESQALRPLLTKACSAHNFLYLCRDPKVAVPELAVLGYLEWVLMHGNKKADGTYWQERCTSFTSFLLDASVKKRSGFSFDELAAYVSLMNTTETTTGISTEDAMVRIAIAVDDAGIATAVLYDDLRMRLQLRHQAQEAELEQGQERQRKDDHDRMSF